MHRSVFVCLPAGVAPAAGPVIHPDLPAARWSARWISTAETAPFDFAVYHFSPLLRTCRQTGDFEWQGRRRPLLPGSNRILM